MTEWRCLICGKSPHEGQRYKTRSGWQSYCRPCTRRVQNDRKVGIKTPRKEGVTNLPAPMTESEAAMRHLEQCKEYRERLTNDILDAYGSECACCGEDEPVFLELDHKKGGGRAHRRRRKGPLAVYAEVRREGYPDSYQLLCSNCNAGKFRNGGICPHQFDRS